MRVHFYIRYHTKIGESLWLSGNVPSLGSENAAQKVAMQYLNDDFWHLEVALDAAAWPDGVLSYKYYFQGIDGGFTAEPSFDRHVIMPPPAITFIKIVDTWNFAGQYENAFYTAPFTNTLFPAPGKAKIKETKGGAHQFKIKAPLLNKDEVVCLLGQGSALGNWSEQEPVLLDRNGKWWQAVVDLSEEQFPVAYKYGIYNKKQKKFVRYEDSGNRLCFEYAPPGAWVVMQDGFISLPNDSWKGAGVAIPVFSLRSKDSFGVGEFNDIKLLADWAKKAGLSMIQLLPVNDTTATHTWKDSYPYAAISAFALHPIYLNLAAVAGKKEDKLINSIRKKQEQFNALDMVDYDGVMRFKTAVLKELFEVQGKDDLESKAYKQFHIQNRHWLEPYAVFSYLRDLYGTPDFNQWGAHADYGSLDIGPYFDAGTEGYTEVQFYCFLQFHLHQQLEAAVQYAHKKGIIIKGDIPIGVYRYGCDAWMSPALYNMDKQAGAPPDDFAAAGQNWGFPTYNWQRMQEDGFEWWRQRFEQMSHYFDAFRIDHILGFFRIWSIPLHAVQGIMGHFEPSIPVGINEFGENGIWFDYERFCKPYINDDVLAHIFGEDLVFVKEKFLHSLPGTGYQLLPDFDTQRKVEAWFKAAEDTGLNQRICLGLYELISNVILFEQEGSHQTQFHFRIALDKTTSYQHLEQPLREKLWNLYIDYFYKRQDDFWKQESLKKLPGLKEATNMLVCGEDLGMVPACVPDVMRDLGILSLEIQRMPKQTGTAFFNPADAPYLAVVTPSTHDMSTIRGWWEEDKPLTQQFYNTMLGQHGAAPLSCEPWVNRAIVLQHLYSPAMWSIFQLQDLLGMSNTLRRDDPAEERINIPADPNHYWRYRMHITLEQLLKEKEFTEELKGFVENSGR